VQNCISCGKKIKDQKELGDRIYIIGRVEGEVCEECSKEITEDFEDSPPEIPECEKNLLGQAMAEDSM